MTNRTDPRPGSPRRRLERRRPAIFDLDRTLLPGSGLVHLGRALARRQIIAPTVLAEFVARELVFRVRGLSETGAHRLQDRLLAMAEGIDLPLLQACGHPVAVNPDRRLRAAAKAANWPILDLR